MRRFYQPDLGSKPDSPFARDANDRLIRRGFWLDMSDHSLVLAMTQVVGAPLTNDEKRAHLTDLKRDHLVAFKRFYHRTRRDIKSVNSVHGQQHLFTAH